MSDVGFPPLQYPSPWPPPELPPYPRHPLEWVPVLGWLIRYFRWLHFNSIHDRQDLDPLAKAIITQLESRPTHGPWPTNAEEKCLVEIISDAVKIEKGLRHAPAIHPDDPFPLLFWGPFDDLTPLLVRIECRDKLHREIPGDMLGEAWNGRWTIHRFIENVMRSRPDKIVIPWDTSKLLTTLLLSGVGMIVGLLLILGPGLAGLWATMTVCCLVVLAGFVASVRQGPRVVITTEGFTVEKLFGAESRRWDEIDGDFTVIPVGWTQAVGYKLVPASQGRRGESRRSMLSGNDAGISGAFTLSPEKLAELLNQHRQAATQTHSPSQPQTTLDP